MASLPNAPIGQRPRRPWLDLEPPRGDSPNKQVEQLASRLYRASFGAARRAMGRYVADDDHDLIEAAQSAGAASEYLVRALLCLHDPVLLADRRDAKSAVALSRANQGSPLEIDKLRTITYGEALELVNVIHPSLGIDPDVRFVMSLRNAAAHMAMTSPALLRDAVARLVQIVSKVHGLLNRNETQYWGAELSSVVATMKDERATAIARTVEAKFARARQVLAELTRDLSSGDAEAVLIAREARPVRWAGDEEEAEECPVCHRTGLIEISTEKGEPVEFEYSDEVSWQVEIFRWATMFQCPVCELVLEDDELPAAGFATELSSRHEEVEDPRVDWGPDEDFYREHTRGE